MIHSPSSVYLPITKNMCGTEHEKKEGGGGGEARYVSLSYPEK
jgi:hypothetical protein